jgi:outer membrane immunogenic protein
MRPVLGFAAGLLVLAAMTPAGAADLPMPTKAPPPPPPPFTWTGFYIGGNVGYGWSNESFNLTSVNSLGTSIESGTNSASGFLGGGQIGANYEFSTHLVIGIEADVDWTDIKRSSTGCATYITGPDTGEVSGCGTNNVQLDDFGTVRGRLGYAWSTLLLYGTGGWAWGHSSGTHTQTCAGPGCPGTSLPFTGGSASISDNFSGWAAGAGLEWAFLPNWTLRVEYLHLEFDNVPTNYSYTVVVNTVPFPVSTHISSNAGDDIVRVGVSYLFH